MRVPWSSDAVWLALGTLAACYATTLSQVDAQVASIRASQPSVLDSSLEARLSSMAGFSEKSSCQPLPRPEPLVNAELVTMICERVSGDTLMYSYRADSNRILAAGRQINLDSARIRVGSDAIEQMLRTEYGVPTVCPIDEWTGPPLTRWLQWRRGSYTVQFRSAVGHEASRDGLPLTVQFQVVRNVVDCGDWIAMPLSG